MKKIIHFCKEYRHLSVVIVALVGGLVLDFSGHHTAAHWTLGITALVSVISLLWEMVQSVRDGEYGVDILAATAIITSVILHEYWAGMVIVLMLTGGEALEDYAEARAKTELSALLKRVPKKAHVLKGRKVVDVAVSEVRVGDKLIIKPGEVVPVDVLIMEGSSSFDESSLTGESLPVDKTISDELLSGSVNIEGAVTTRALRAAADSQFEQIIKLVRSAASTQSPFVRLADRYSVPFSVIAFVIAGTVWAISGHAIRFLEVLVVATPCPLLLGAPIALISGMSRAAKHGIIVKTGSAMERLAEVKTIAFDKTGTLTQGQPQVDTIKVFGSFKSSDILSLAASIEQSSTHILARSLVNAAGQQNLRLTKAKHVKEESGRGLSGRIGGQQVLVGRLAFMKDQKVRFPRGWREPSSKHTVTFVAASGELAGTISFIDEVRSEAISTLKRLKQAGLKHFLMVTGDNEITAQAIAKQLGIDEVKANCLPADKLQAIEAVQDRPVAFVGDGVNDAPVLTASDVGIALGARGSTAASESADVVIMLDDLSRVATAAEIAKRTFFVGKQSILIGIGLSVGLMAIFATGRFKPVYGAAIQELVDITVIINALRAHGSWRKDAAPAIHEPVQQPT